MLPTNEILETIKNNKTKPDLFHNIRSAAKRIQAGTPSAEDYRLVFQYPAMAQMFIKKY